MNKKTILGIAVIALTVIVAFTACSGSGGGGKSLNSAEALKEYLDKQPANSPDKPIKVAMKANDMMIGQIVGVIVSAGKYVSLDLSGSPLTEIPREAFRGCKMLAGITIPDSVTSIGFLSFCQTGLTSITIPNSVTYIDSSAFERCTSLTGITIPNSVTVIGDSAFGGCTSLTSVTIPNSVTKIDPGAFGGCDNLTSVTFQGTIAPDNLGEDYSFFVSSPFPGDLRDKYLAGGIGTYTTTAPVDWNDSIWTKQ